MGNFFADRDDIAEEEPLRISPHVAKAMTALVDRNGPPLYQALGSNLVVSCAYWLLNIRDSTHVTYHTTEAPSMPATQKGQQGASYVCLAYLMGLVKEPIKDNAAACTKSWSAGLAGVQKSNLLSESFMTTVWQVLVDKKADFYGRSHVRQDIMRKYLEVRASTGTEPSLVRAVMSQLELVYTNAYLKSVNLMSMFSTFGSHALVIPSVTQEAMALDTVLTKVKAAEGTNYETCRLIDPNKHPELNHAHYPNLYAATLEWARRGKKVQKNYQGSKNLIEQAVHLDVVRKVLKMSSATMSTASRKTEQKGNSKGYIIPSLPLSELLMADPKRRARSTPATESSSESESDVETDTRHKRRRRH